MSTGAEKYYWIFEGGNPVSSTDKEPGPVTYSNPGNYWIKLHAIMEADTLTITKCLLVDPSGVYEWETFVEEEDMPFAARWTALPMVIGDFLFVGGGGEADGVTRGNYESDFYRVDMSTGNFESIPDYPAGMISFGTSFILNGKGYAGSGRIGGSERSSLCYVYDPSTNEWTQAIDFPGEARSNAVSDAVNGKAYFGFGVDNNSNYLKDFWEYDQERNTWEQLAEFPGVERIRTMMFSICNSIYIAGGSANEDPRELNDTWRYDIESNEWTRVADIPVVLNSAGSESIGSYGYLISGDSDTLNESEYSQGVAGNTYTNDVYRYDPALDKWESVNHFPYFSRPYPLTFVYNGELYFGISGILLSSEEFIGEYGLYRMMP